MTYLDLLVAIEAANVNFAGEGRVLIRASGTEPLIRVMAEGDDSAKVKTIVNSFVKLIQRLTVIS